LNCKSQLLRDAVVDIVSVGRSLDGHGRSCIRIKVRDILSKNMLDEVYPQGFGSTDCRYGYQHLTGSVVSHM
jgi:hypothetical protein